LRAPRRASVPLPRSTRVIRHCVRTIDPRGQRFGAGLSAVTLIVGIGLDLQVVAAVVGLALAVSAALGTQWFLVGRPWPSIRSALRLGPPRGPEPELGPRFAQALGTLFIAVGLALFAAGATPWFWAPIAAVAGLQTLLAVSGYCLGCAARSPLVPARGLRPRRPARAGRAADVAPEPERSLRLAP
jgi:hypothetical protein